MSGLLRVIGSKDTHIAIFDDTLCHIPDVIRCQRTTFFAILPHSAPSWISAKLKIWQVSAYKIEPQREWIM